MLTHPLALLGLVALPTLVTIYLLKNRVKHRTVSSLMLWSERASSSTGGSWIQRNPLPLIFFLEMLILLLLIWAATGPMRLAKRSHRPLVIVLDNSASMAARGNDGKNAAERALNALPKLIKSEQFSPVRIVLASDDPQWLSADDVALVLQGKQPDAWSLRAAECAQEAAFLLAKESRDSSKILMVSDRYPQEGLPAGTLRWMAFGAAASNAGFINAVRSGARCMVELAGSGPTQLTLKRGAQTQTLTVELPCRKVYRLADANDTFEASLPDDALEIDNQIILLPKSPIFVPVEIEIQDAELHQLVSRGVAATGFDRSGRAEMVFTDSVTAANTNLNAWVVHLVTSTNTLPFTGPFVLDRTSPLLSGLEFGGLVWAGSKEVALPGMPLILAGNTALLTQLDDLAGRTHFYLQMDPALSSVQHSPMWPTLIWNLLRERAEHQPGLKEVNLRPGMSALETDLPGLMELEVNGVMLRKVYNFLSAEESALAHQARGDYGSWLAAETVEREYIPLAPLLALASLVLLALHQYLLRQPQRGAK